MSEFHRMITYLYLYERGIKRHNVGFAKIEKRDSQCLVEIHMKNTGHSLSPIPVYFYAENQQKFPGILLGTMGLTRGNGDFKTILKGETLCDSSYRLDDVSGIFIPLDSEIMFVSQWNDREFVRERFAEPRNQSEPAPQKKSPEPASPATPGSTEPSAAMSAGPGQGNRTADPGSTEPSAVQAASTGSIPSQTAPEDELPPFPLSGSGDSDIPAPSSVPDSDLRAAEAAPKLAEFPRQNRSFPSQSQTQASAGSAQKPEPLPENWSLKWDFILENYPVMTPFAGDESTLCVRLELKDLRLLPRQYWYLGNNSFLLHGFFNYRYLILGMTEKNGKKRWFVGIPGIYQNPERVMATLFGFPEFRNEKSVPVNTGEFGYWYRYLNEP